jgi:hypothetical protein
MSKYLLAVASLSFLFMLGACSDDSHSTTKPIDLTAMSSSFTLDDLDDLLGNTSSSSVEGGKTTPMSSSVPGGKTTLSSSSAKNTKVSSSSSKKEGGKTSDETKSSSSKSNPGETTTKGFADCDLVMDSKGLLALTAVNKKAADIFEALADLDKEDLEDRTTELKPMYKRIIDKYPNSCGAKLGYAVTSVVDLVNNETLGNLASDYKHWFNGNISSIDDFVQMAEEMSSNERTFTKNTQKVLLEEVLPTIDTAISYMQYVLAQDDYFMRVENVDFVRELDKSEFGVILGGLFATKAVILVATSLNFEIDDNGDYSWMKDLKLLEDVFDERELDEDQTAVVKVLENLIGVNGTFTKVHSKKKFAWMSVPTLLDSALSEVKDAFEYSIAEASKPGSQTNDLYIVGRGADADVSKGDLQELIDKIDDALDGVRGSVTVSVNGEELECVFRKFFEQGDGFEAFLPYYSFEDKSDLNTFYFTDKNGEKTVPVSRFIDKDLVLPDDGPNNIIFPDPTFGGIFPQFKTQKDLWDFLDAI